jgi:hypothetical protein
MQAWLSAQRAAEATGASRARGRGSPQYKKYGALVLSVVHATLAPHRRRDDLPRQDHATYSPSVRVSTMVCSGVTGVSGEYHGLLSTRKKKTRREKVNECGVWGTSYTWTTWPRAPASTGPTRVHHWPSCRRLPSLSAYLVHHAAGWQIRLEWTIQQTNTCTWKSLAEVLNGYPKVRTWQ